MEKPIPNFLVLIGIPGSGKSRWIDENASGGNYFVVSPDLIRKELWGDISDVSKDKEVWDLAKKRVVEHLEKRNNVILDATNVNDVYRKKFIQDLPPCRLLAKIFEISPEKAKERIRNDIETGVDRSNVPEEIIDKMYNQFKNLSSPAQLREEGFEIIENIKH